MGETIREGGAIKTWPFEEAKKILKSLHKGVPAKGFVLFQTGYGPSGSPHIGTFGEVARTLMVQRALTMLEPGLPSKMYVFSDDMDGLRKIPDNVPEYQKKRMEEDLLKPLTRVFDPFETHASFAHRNNEKLCAFLDSFGFVYDFQSASKLYGSGYFDTSLKRVLQCYDQIMAVVLPTLGPERALTYSPFLPICKNTGRVLQVPMVDYNVEAGEISYEIQGKRHTVSIYGGSCKLQWKVDWAMRWYALDVNYEMSGKDLAPSVELSSKICKILGSKPPQSFTYELFLDEKGEKISKSKGNGLSIEEWLRYAPQESLSYFMYLKPKTAKRLFFDVIPKSVDEMIQGLNQFIETKNLEDRLSNPLWYVFFDDKRAKGLLVEKTEISFSMLLNLVSASNAETPEVLWGFLVKYNKNLNKETLLLRECLGYALKYYYDCIAPYKKYKIPSHEDKRMLHQLIEGLEGRENDSFECVQSAVFNVGKENIALYEGGMKGYFQRLYEILLGSSQGPRMGSFVCIYGVENFIRLIRSKI